MSENIINATSSVDLLCYSHWSCRLISADILGHVTENMSCHAMETSLHELGSRALTNGFPDLRYTRLILGSNSTMLFGPTMTPVRSRKLAPWKTKFSEVTEGRREKTKSKTICDILSLWESEGRGHGRLGLALEAGDLRACLLQDMWYHQMKNPTFLKQQKLKSLQA
jgi:hypothetical protein